MYQTHAKSKLTITTILFIQQCDEQHTQYACSLYNLFLECHFQEVLTSNAMSYVQTICTAATESHGFTAGSRITAAYGTAEATGGATLARDTGERQQ